ncbi:hypothetical protein AAULR_13447 [Lacticaseibacillus rhamnosus MTCC 5462]|uniref:hypothetical protein n=1 Tax=Lacticaseibacillus rhamnosus TaxID=47715 RepID=UPI000205F320|nr:hypothetical protein [Lacticaseibacillus rhamnosus]AGP71436.1 Hypothetical protein LOCK900_1630 [Lacticaseibacillus rhamnosus LOCK900]EGF48901.1 hypothetical protein AAULR_13447 [Lacticaseibacillus rhamnosus MTCC 5462]EHJ30942.1 hypothetical protein HMPREF0541_01492 [Lacticaseibacillus rhamnosus ATCC 21052]
MRSQFIRPLFRTYLWYGWLYQGKIRIETVALCGDALQIIGVSSPVAVASVSAAC